MTTRNWRSESLATWLIISGGFGDGNVLIRCPTYTQIITPGAPRFGDIDPDDFDVFVVKSRVHFRRGFDETGYAKTILVVDAPGDWFGTMRLDALDYEHAPIESLYPFGSAVWLLDADE